MAELRKGENMSGPEGYKGEGWEAPEFDPEDLGDKYPDDVKKSKKAMVDSDVEKIVREGTKKKPELSEEVKANEPSIPRPEHYDTDSERPWYDVKDEDLK